MPTFTFTYDRLDGKKITSQPKTLGEAIKYYRTHKNWTQKQLGKAIGIHSHTISLLEQERNKLHVNYILKIEQALHCNLKGYDEYCDFARDTATNIKKIRKDLKMTQKEFAEYLGLCKTTVGKWECASSYIPRKNYISLRNSIS